MTVIRAVALCLCVCVCGAGTRATAQEQADSKPPVERLGPDKYRVRNIQVDTTRKEIAVPASTNQVTVVEFLANAKAGIKAYETALTVDTDAISFNLALVLIGLDKNNAKPAKHHFDPTPVAGDPVELTVEVFADGKRTRMPVERLLYDKATNATVPEGEWVYTGSGFQPDGRYLAAMEGTLIGFAHSPAAIIESAKGIGIGRYGSIVVNPALPLAPGAKLMLYVRALPPSPRGKQK